METREETTMIKTSISEMDTRYLKTYYITGNDQMAVENEKKRILRYWPTVGYGTSATKTVWDDTDRCWLAKVTRSHHCD